LKVASSRLPFGMANFTLDISIRTTIRNIMDG